MIFFSATNPSIEGGGCGIESKYEVFKLIPKSLKPKTAFIKKGSNKNEILSIVKLNEISFPLIAKPNIGYRGMLVRKINSIENLYAYFEKFKIDAIIQEFVAAKKEFGLLYYRLPNEETGHITSLISKEYMIVTGNGENSILDLARKDEHLLNHWHIIMRNFKPEYLKSIPRKDEKIILSYIGNHSKGAKFYNENENITPELVRMMDGINHQINNWYYGRLDIKCDSMEELLNGDFKIIDLNGVSGEPAHMYDASSSSYFKAIKILKEHWDHIQSIATISHKIGNKYAPIIPILKSVFRMKVNSMRLTRLARRK